MSSENKKLVLGKHCFVCGNNGFFDKDCPSCGRVAKNKSLNLDKRDDANEFVTKAGMQVVPDHYKGVIWNAETLRSTKPEKEKDLTFQRFVEGLDAVNNVFAKGVLSRQSAMIIAPAGFSKVTLAYSCMQRAVDNGFSVAPLLDTVEIKRILTLAGENPNYKFGGKLSYDDYVYADVLFATVTKLPAREWAYEVIQELIDRRARVGLSTFILSRYDLSEITKRDYANQFSSITTAVSEDGCKYPAIIRYREIRG